MDSQRVPDLEQMDEQEAFRFLAELLANLDPRDEYQARHPEDYVLEMPQSGERFRGRENVRAFQEAYPAARGEDPAPTIRVSRVLVRERLWVAEGVADYGGGRVANVVLIFELKDGRMWHDRWYFAEPFEAPEWRAQWVEQIEA